MSTRRFLLVPLLAFLLLGCGQTPPAPPPAPPPPAPAPVGINKEIEKAVETGVGDLATQIKKAEREMEQRSVWFVFDGVRDEKHRGELFAKIQQLRDAKGTNTSFASRGGYSENGACFQMSPISDIEAAAAKVDFGLLLAVDPVNRIMVVDASAKPAPRPEKGWPGAKAVDEYIVQSIAKRFARRVDDDLIKKFGRDKVVIVLAPADYPINKKLGALEVLTSAGYPGTFGPQQKPFNLSTVGPIAKLNDMVKLLDNGNDVVVDEERRFVIVDFAGVKPRRAEANAQQPAQPK